MWDKVAFLFEFPFCSSESNNSDVIKAHVPDMNLKSFSYSSVPPGRNYNTFYTQSPSFQGSIMFGTVEVTS